jgi:predicted ATP-grasp superfamily ATP-dependent carboligase
MNNEREKVEQLQIESLDKLPNGDMYILKPKDGAGSIGMEFVTKDEFGLLLGIEENDKIKTAGIMEFINPVAKKIL